MLLRELKKSSERSRNYEMETLHTAAVDRRRPRRSKSIALRCAIDVSTFRIRPLVLRRGNQTPTSPRPLKLSEGQYNQDRIHESDLPSHDILVMRRRRASIQGRDSYNLTAHVVSEMVE